MKKLCILLCIFSCLIISGCAFDFNNSVKGWCVDNKSDNQVTVFFDNTPIYVDANSVTYFDDISEDATVNIADSFHVNYDISYRYSTTREHSRLLQITDKIRYQYSILNNSSETISFTYNNNSYSINAGSTMSFTVYDQPYTFTFTANNYQYNYTTNYSNGITYIVIQ